MLPFGKNAGWEMVLKVLAGTRPSKPENAPQLGLSDKVWELLEDCWQTERGLRPSVKIVLHRVKSAARVCGTLPSVKDAAHRQEDHDSDLNYGLSPPSSSGNVGPTRFRRSSIR